MRRWLWLLPLVLLQACAGTPLAERLERSFAAPDEPVQPPATSPLPSQPEQTPVSTEAPRAESMAESESVARTEPELPQDRVPTPGSSGSGQTTPTFGALSDHHSSG